MDHTRSFPALGPRYSWGTAVLSALCLTIAGTSLYLFIDDLRAAGSRGRGPSLAIVEHLQSAVRRKPSSSFLWSRVKTGEKLYRRDVIESGPESSASLKLMDGSLLELGENSLVVIDNDADLALRFLQGSFVVHEKTRDRRVSIDAGGRRVEETLPVRLAAPEPYAARIVPNDTPSLIAFTWIAPEKPIANLAIEISPSRKFPAATLRRLSVTDEKQTQITLSLPPGEYYWRLRHPEGPVSEARVVRLVAAPRLVGMRPARADKLVRWPDASDVDFRWIPPTPPHHHSRRQAQAAVSAQGAELELSATSDFKVVSRATRVSLASGAARLADIPAGSYFWRLKASYPGVTVSSDPLAFSVVSAPKLPVALLAPAPQAVIPESKRAHFNWSVEGARDLHFTWELARGDSEAPLISRATEAALVDIELEDPGAYRWRVIARRKGALIAESEWRPVVVADGAPLVLDRPLAMAKLFFWGTPAPVKFEWNADSDAKANEFQYRLELSSDEAFRKPVLTDAVKTTSTTFTPTPSEKAQFWRVALIDKNGTPRKYSEPRSLVYGPHAPLMAPVKASPPANFVFKRQSKEAAPSLSWAPVDEAKRYEVVVRRKDKAIWQKIVTDTHAEPKDLEVGDYEWQVRAIDPTDRAGAWLAARALHITFGDPLAAPEIVHEEVK